MRWRLKNIGTCQHWAISKERALDLSWAAVSATGVRAPWAAGAKLELTRFRGHLRMCGGVHDGKAETISG